MGSLSQNQSQSQSATSIQDQNEHHTDACVRWRGARSPVEDAHLSQSSKSVPTAAAARNYATPNASLYQSQSVTSIQDQREDQQSIRSSLCVRWRGARSPLE